MVAQPVHSIPPMKKRDEVLRVLPFGCSTYHSNDVIEHLSQVKLGGAASAFCMRLHRETFGNAGLQKSQGKLEPGLWCDFDLKTWSRTLSMDKSNLRRIRSELEECHIVRFIPDAEHPGYGHLGWNLNFQEWQQYNARPLRTERNALRRTQKQSGAVLLPDEQQQSSVVVLAQKDDAVLPQTTLSHVNAACDHGSSLDIASLTRPGTDEPQLLNVGILTHFDGVFLAQNSITKKVKMTTNFVKITTDDCLKPVKITTLPSQEAALQKHSQQALRRSGKESVRSADADASVASVNASQGAVVPSQQKISPRATNTPKVAKDERAVQLHAYRSTLMGIRRQAYSGRMVQEGKEVAAIKRLFEANVQLEEVIACWEITRLDPWFKQRTLGYADICFRIEKYLTDPDEYRTEILRKTRKGEPYAQSQNHSTIGQAPANSAEYRTDW